MQIVEWAKSHPIASGAIVIIGGIIFIMIVRGGSSGSSGSTASGPSDAEIMADAQIKGAQIAAQASAAQAGAAVQAAQIGAGVQLNSDNKAAEIYMAKINAEKELGLGVLAQQTKMREQVIKALPSLNKNNRDDVLHSLTTGYQGDYRGGQENSLNKTLGQVGGLLSSVGSLFSDARLKENIKHIGYDKRGRDLYEFNYKGSNKKRVGYMAQSVERSEPENVTIDHKTGYKRINAIALN